MDREVADGELVLGQYAIEEPRDGDEILRPMVQADGQFGPKTADCLLGALQRFQLGAFDVHLDEVALSRRFAKGKWLVHGVVRPGLSIANQAFPR